MGYLKASDYVVCNTFLANKDKSPPPILFFCKSGKDRTGFVSYSADVNLIHISSPELDIHQIYKAAARAAHPQFLSSVNGGMAGRVCMKPVRCNEAVSSIRVSKKLFPQAAMLTKF